MNTDSSILFENLTRINETLQSVFIGQPQVINEVLIALLARGHVLLEGVPGLGKTLLVRTLAQLIDADFSRIQFTPDLMPADVTGHTFYDHQSGQFRINKGPVFTNLLLADEINRSPAKTQAALLEVMEEHRVTLDGKTMDVGNPFIVLATQNPIEQEGTFNLPEAQLDRFLLKIKIDYPDQKNEFELIKKVASNELTQNFSKLTHIIDRQVVAQLQLACSQLTIDDVVLNYIVELIRSSRNHLAISYGAGPRGSIALLKAARAHAMLAGRDFVVPDDVKAIFMPVMRHRILLSPEQELSGNSSDTVLSALLESVASPKQ